MSDRNRPVGDNPFPEDNVGAELRWLFDVEKENLPPLFFETLQLSRGVDEEIAGYRGLEERALRRFFARIGRDYDDWYRVRRQRRRRRFAAAVFVGLLFLVLGAVLFTPSGVLEALRLPLFQQAEQSPTPFVGRSVTRYARVAEIQPFFSIPLPPSPPAGFRLVNVSLETGFPAGPRAVLFYQRGDPSNPDDRSAEAHLVVWSLQDEPFPLPLGAAPEAVELDGLAASWVAGTVGGVGPAWRDRGGILMWECESWKFALVSSTLPRAELVQIGTELVRQ